MRRNVLGDDLFGAGEKEQQPQATFSRNMAKTDFL